ncbi:hypothetical protein JCM11251_003942 [Rhodosporidiobolus azoricus]
MSTLAHSPTLSFSTLPPELLLKILFHACTTARLSAPLLVHNQFTQLETSCRACVYRNLAGVCREWRNAVREIMGREVALAYGCGSEAKDDQVIALVEKDKRRASGVKKVDASLRRAMCGWAGWSSPPAQGSTEATHSGESEGGVTTQGVELERKREQAINRERQRLYRLLSSCRLVDTLDVDLGFYYDLRAQPRLLLPPTIRSLTLRNSEPLDVLAVMNALPLLEDLTLRLALDFFLPPTCAHLHNSPSRLKSFELSTTAFGVTSLPTVLALLSNSHESLASLTLRNKGSAPGVVEAFYPIARGLIEMFAGRLEELVVKDIPRGGMRPSGCAPSLDWFPTRPPTLPHLHTLSLTGLPLPCLSFFSQTLVLPSPLKSLTIEDFDALSARPLIDALNAVPALKGLEELNVAFGREVECARREGGVWEKECEEVEGWCTEEKVGRITELKASWKMVKVTGCRFW